MLNSFDLTRLDERSFEHLANLVALRVLGAGHTSFGPGSDGGRDGYFRGEAPYPSSTDRWSGTWHLQSKFHRPHLSTDPQKWLLGKISEELEEYTKPGTKRTWPDNWILVTNIDPSGAPETGAFDKAQRLVRAENPALAEHFHIWGGAKLLQLLSLNPQISEYYAHFLTPGHILTRLYESFEDNRATASSVIRHFVVTQFGEQQFTKLEQAGSTIDTRPGIHRLFTDVPFTTQSPRVSGLCLDVILQASTQIHKNGGRISDLPDWSTWHRDPRRARVWFVKGGPGQGKSTVTQYLSQIYRAFLILSDNAPQTTPQQLQLAREIRSTAESNDLWPLAARIPVYVELKDFAKWFGDQSADGPTGLFTYLSWRLSARIEQPVSVGLLKRAFSSSRWLFVFDGLDEVPGDVKDAVAREVISFTNDSLVSLDADAFFICTSRPQGYSGQFAELAGAEAQLSALDEVQALNCAAPVLSIDRDELEAKQNCEILKDALQSSSIAEIMTTPLQAHIMAVVVRDGGRPPDRRWQLFSNYYQVIKKREANRNLPDKRISTLLRTGDKLLKSLHNRLGYELHARAETSSGAQTSIDRSDLSRIINQTVTELHSSNISETVAILLEATTERLVLVNTPESGTHVRFDIRPLQEFFAAEFIHEDTSAERLRTRLTTIAGDSHWPEVIHFVLSALVEGSRRTDLTVVVETLDFVNIRDSTSPSRHFYRRLASGAIPAARLLAEGVLEQDRRVRQQFKKCIEPLFGSTEADLAEILASTRGDDSASWLIETLVDVLQDQAESECIGAAYVACRLVHDDDPRVATLERIISEKSASFLECLFRMLHQQLKPEIWRDHSWMPERWLTRLALSALTSSRWRELGTRGVASAFAIIESRPASLSSIARSIGLESNLADLLPKLVCKADKRAPDHQDNWSGFVKATFYRPDKALDWSDWSNELRIAIQKAPGALSLIYPVFSLAAGDRSLPIVESLISDAEFLRVLPDTWKVFVPRELSGTQIFEATDFVLDTVTHNFTWYYKPGYTFELSLSTSEEKEDIGEFFREHTETTLNLFEMFTSHHSHIPSMEKLCGLINSPQGASLVAAAASDNPQYFSRFERLWGDFIQLCGPDSTIRESLTKSAAYWQIERSRGEFRTPFPLQLPNESSLIAPVLYSILTNVYRSSDTRHLDSDLLICFPSIEALLQLANSTSCSVEVKGASAMACLVHPNTPPVLRAALIDIVASGYHPNANSWYLALAGHSLSPLVAEGDAIAIDALGSMIRAGSHDFRSRLNFEEVFENWRERSKAPVTAFGLEEFGKGE